jgi:AcrR family transcriptional regulator
VVIEVTRKTAPKPKRGAPAKGEPSARDRILETAARLFYRDGIRASGVDTIVDTANISKTSLYRTFETKDELIGAVVEMQSQQYWQWWDRTVSAHPDDPRAQLKALLVGIGKTITNPEFRGCPFIKAASEFPDESHPGGRAARANKIEMQRRLAEICKKMRCRNPARLGVRLVLLVNGAYMSAAVGNPEEIKTELIRSALALVEPDTES